MLQNLLEIYELYKILVQPTVLQYRKQIYTIDFILGHDLILFNPYLLTPVLTLSFALYPVTLAMQFITSVTDVRAVRASAFLYGEWRDIGDTKLLTTPPLLTHSRAYRVSVYKSL